MMLPTCGSDGGLVFAWIMGLSFDLSVAATHMLRPTVAQRENRSRLVKGSLDLSPVSQVQLVAIYVPTSLPVVWSAPNAASRMECQRLFSIVFPLPLAAIASSSRQKGPRSESFQGQSSEAEGCVQVIELRKEALGRTHPIDSTKTKRSLFRSCSCGKRCWARSTRAPSVEKLTWPLFIVNRSSQRCALKRSNQPRRERSRLMKSS